MKTRGRWRSDHPPHTGAFSGYTWGENVGWISRKGGSGATAYGVVTDFRQFEIYLPLVLKPS